MPFHLSRYATLMLAASVALHTASAQKDSPAERLKQARPTYYTPTANGLKSFSCNVSFDWKAFLASASGKDIEDDNVMLVYLRAVKLSVADDLQSGGELGWTATAVPPEGLADSAGQLRDSMKQMMGGFFQSWNVYMNGGMVPLPDESVTFTNTGEGFIMHGADGKMVIDEKFDKSFLLTEAHVVSNELDVFAYPTYIDTSDGRVISSIRSIYRAPPSAPPVEVLVGVKYATVSTFRIPSDLDLSVKNVGSFPFHFTGCVVKSTVASDASKP
jgi:hypothetical protein